MTSVGGREALRVVLVERASARVAIVNECLCDLPWSPEYCTTSTIVGCDRIVAPPSCIMVQNYADDGAFVARPVSLYVDLYP